MKPYRICLLGGLQFQSGQHALTRFRTQKTATLLAYLALHRGPQPREVLADLGWPDDAPEAARHSLRMALSSLRSQLETSNSGQHQEPLFEVTRFAIGLRAEAVSTDVADFDEAIKSARHAPDADERAHHYAAATELYCGPFLPGFYDDWCLEAAARLEADYDAARQFLQQWRVAHDQTSNASSQRLNAHSQLPNVSSQLPDTSSQAPHRNSQAPHRDSQAPHRDSQASHRNSQASNSKHLATLLVFDGAALTRNIEQQLKLSGGARGNASSATEIEALQRWSFASASAAIESAALVRDESRRLALCTGERASHDSTELWTRARGLLQSAGAGQTVCCEATALFARARADIKCRDLGVYHLPVALPGAAPERVFQISWAHETARQWAPLRAKPARGASVPRPLDKFFGRQTELAQLRAHLENSRLITLLGAGGAGKTRLALQLAATLEIERAAPFYGAVFWVALSDIPQADGIAPALCDALHLERAGQTSPLEAATAALHLAPATLLILDNFEHLVEEGAAIIERLLEGAPNARCLVTSRRLLGARGEIEVALAPLQVPARAATVEALQGEPSVQLFCDRARLVRPDFALTSHNAAAVAALCRHLEGIPLALELAAARAGQLAPARILERLQAHAETPFSEQLDWLRNAARTAPARHRTLRAALRWSVDELDAALQALLARLSVFRGGCFARDAVAVCRMPNADEALEELRARSLLVRVYDEGEARYSMLETVRQYAQEMAESREETEDLRRRHAHYFLSWAQSEAPIAIASDATARVQSWRRVRARGDNLRAALSWSRRHEPATALQIILACQDFSGAHLSRAELDIADALSAIEGQVIESEIVASALKLAAIQAAHRGDIAAQNEFALRHLDLIREMPDAPPETLAWAYFNWGSARHRSGHASIARAALQQSLALFSQLEAPRCHQCRAWTLIEMGNSAFDAGELEVAAADFEQCDLAFAASGDRDGQASAKAQLADVCFQAGDHARAAQLWPQVGQIMRELGDEREHEWRRHQEGKHAVATGDLERGHQLLLRALRAFESDGQKLGLLRSLLALSYYWLERDQPARARQLLQVEANERQQLNWPVDGSWEQLRQQLWQRAQAGEHDAEIPALASTVAAELGA